MTLKSAFVYACLLMSSSLLFILIIQLMSWGIIWMTTHFPGALGVVIVLLLALAIVTCVVYFGYRWLIVWLVKHSNKGQ